MEWLLLLLMVWSILYGLYWLGKIAEWLENAGKKPVIHIHNHPIQREIYVERIHEKESKVYIR